MEWKFEREEQQFELVPVGRHRVRIASVEKAISQNGNDMLFLKLDVSGHTQQIWHNIVFLVERPEVTNRMLTQLFDSFGIEDGNFNLQSWVGKVGACQTKHEEYNGKTNAKVSYFIHKNKQDDLPPWQNKAKVKMEELKPVEEDELPF